jgi:hypothetical protein
MLADAAWVVIDPLGRVVMFVGDLTKALLYKAKTHGELRGPMTVAAAKALVDAAAKKLYG